MALLVVIMGYTAISGWTRGIHEFLALHAWRNASSPNAMRFYVYLTSGLVGATDSIIPFDGFLFIF